MTLNWKKFEFIDLFAGIGGIRIPFDELGGDCVLSSEWDKDCQGPLPVDVGSLQPHSKEVRQDPK